MDLGFPLPIQYTPDDFKFQPEANPPAFTSSATGESIRRGSRIRLRIVGVRGEQSDFVSLHQHCQERCAQSYRLIFLCYIGPDQFAIGSIKGDYLGPMEE
jgi:DNA-directed RNA polymerase subunit E'/Rpb7